MLRPQRYPLFNMSLFSFLFDGDPKPSGPYCEAAGAMLPGEISFSQLDVTEGFDDYLRLKPEDWMATEPLNKSVPHGKGLPPLTASDEEVYAAGAKLSQMRDSISVPGDGVYCPVCHIANTELAKLHTPCPKCARPLLRFGWD